MANYDQKVIMHVDRSLYNKECSPILIIQVGGGGGYLFSQVTFELYIFHYSTREYISFEGTFDFPRFFCWQ